MTWLKKLRSSIVAPLAGVVFLAAGAQAAPQGYSFSQSFGAAGNLTGSFSAEDSNGSGRIELNELRDLQATFTGGIYSGSFQFIDINVGDFDWKVADVDFVDEFTGLSLSTALSPTTRPQTMLGLYWAAGSSVGLSGISGDDAGHLYFFDDDGNTSNLWVATNRVSVSAAIPPVSEPSIFRMLLLGISAITLIGIKRSRSG